MALTKKKKQEVVQEVSSLLQSSKLTVVTKYKGTDVKALQDLRRQTKDNGTKFRVVKNRLAIKALQSTQNLKDVDTSALRGMLLYAFNDQDEAAPAQSLKAFAKTNPNIEFVGAITADGKFMIADEVKTLAGLPSKNQLIAQVIATLGAPLNDVLNGLSGNLHALLDGIEAKASN